MTFFKKISKGPHAKITGVKVLVYSFFSSFKKKYPQYDKVPNKDLSKIVRTFNEILAEQAAENRDGVELPERIGIVLVANCGKKKGLYVNEKASAEAGTIVPEKCWETDNTLCKIAYVNSPYRYAFKHRKFWVFSGNKRFRKLASQAYLKEWNKYHDIKYLGRQLYYTEVAKRENRLKGVGARSKND